MAPTHSGAAQSNPGNFANRPHEEVENIARKGGQHSHQGGFHNMDEEKQVCVEEGLLISPINVKRL